MKKIIFGSLLSTWCSLACAGTSPNLTYGQVLTPGQWNQLFINKEDELGYTPLNVNGGVMLGRLVTAPPTTTAGLNLTPGSSPSAPANGDIWATSSNFFIRVNGVTSAIVSSSPASFAGTPPIAVTFPSGVVTYAFDFTVANTWLAQQTEQGASTTQPGWYVKITGDSAFRARIGTSSTDASSLAFGPGNGFDAFLERQGAASFRFGGTDAGAPVAQTIGVQNVSAGTSNTAGTPLTITGSRGTGTGAGGAILFQTAPLGGSGTAQNALVTALTIFPSGGLATLAATDQGAGTLNLGGGNLYNNGTAPTGTGAYVRGSSPSLTTPAIAGATLSGTQSLTGTLSSSGGTISGSFAGTPTFSGANFVTLANIVQDATAWSLLGNATSGTANYAPFTIGGLTNKTTPATTDLLVIQDQAASGALKFCTLAQCIAAVSSGVTSFGVGARTGTVTGEADDYKAFSGMTVPQNCTLAVTASAGALTGSIKDNAGSTPTTTSPCVVPFPDGAGGYTPVLVTAATTFTTGATGSTFGVPSTTPFHLWWTLWNNAGTVVLGASVQASTTQIFPINEAAFETSVACSACTTATSAGVYYTTAILTSKAKRIFAYTEWTSGLATAGVWTAPSFTQLFGPGIKKPGDPIQGATVSLQRGASLTATTHNGTNVIDSIGGIGTAFMQIGEPVTGTGVGAAAVISTITSGTAITVSVVGTSSATNTITFSWGTTASNTTFVATNMSIPNFTLSSAANSVAFSGTALTTANAGFESYLAVIRGGVQVTPDILGSFGAASVLGVASAGLGGNDFPGSPGPFTYTVSLKANATGGVGACDTNGACIFTATEFMR